VIPKRRTRKFAEVVLQTHLAYPEIYSPI